MFVVPLLLILSKAAQDLLEERASPKPARSGALFASLFSLRTPSWRCIDRPTAPQPPTRTAAPKRDYAFEDFDPPVSARSRTATTEVSSDAESASTTTPTPTSRSKTRPRGVKKRQLSGRRVMSNGGRLVLIRSCLGQTLLFLKNVGPRRHHRQRPSIGGRSQRMDVSDALCYSQPEAMLTVRRQRRNSFLDVSWRNERNVGEPWCISCVTDALDRMVCLIQQVVVGISAMRASFTMLKAWVAKFWKTSTLSSRTAMAARQYVAGVLSLPRA